MITDADETLLWCQFSFGVQSTQVGSRYMSESFGERDTEACAKFQLPINVVWRELEFVKSWK